MAKEIKKKASRVGHNANKKRNQEWENAKRLLEKGETFGDSIITMMSLIANDWKGMGVAAVGLARAWAFLKNLSESIDVDLEKLFKGELANYEKEFGEILDDDNDED